MPSDWTTEQVVAWVAQQPGMPASVADAFRADGYTGEDLMAVSLDELRDMGLKGVHAKRLLRAVRRLVETQGAEPAYGDDEKQAGPRPVAVPALAGSRMAAPPKKKEVSLVFLGESGVGKSTLLQSIKDFMRGTPFEEARATPRAAGRSAGESQTQDVTLHELGNESWVLNIIDTPGIGDTQGIKKDEEHVRNIVEFLGSVTFNAVCILIKRGEVRKSIRLQYVVNEIRQHMPRDVEQNFMVIMTRSEVPTPDVHTLQVIKDLHLPVGNIVPINNLAYEEVTESDLGDPESMIAQAAREARRSAYENNHKFFELLLKEAHKLTPYKGSKLLVLKKKRDELKERVGLLTRMINDTFATENQVKQKLAELQKAKRDELNFANFTKTTTFTQYRYEKETGKITTWCNPCSRGCHIDCGLSYGDDLTGCCAMSGSTCNQCGHSVSNHTHMGWKKVPYAQTSTVEDAATKAKWHDAKGRQQVIAKAKASMEAKLVQLQRDRDRMVKEIAPLYKELEGLALVGHNESYEKYIKECQQATKKAVMAEEDREAKLAMYDSMLQQFQVFTGAIKKGGSWLLDKMRRK